MRCDRVRPRRMLWIMPTLARPDLDLATVYTRGTSFAILMSGACRHRLLIGDAKADEFRELPGHCNLLVLILPVKSAQANIIRVGNS